jgi:hypothetical protein
MPPYRVAWRKLLGSVPGRFFNELRSRDFSITLITLGSSPGVGLSVRDYRIQRNYRTRICGADLPKAKSVEDFEVLLAFSNSADLTLEHAVRMSAKPVLQAIPLSMALMFRGLERRVRKFGFAVGYMEAHPQRDALSMALI